MEMKCTNMGGGNNLPNERGEITILGHCYKKLPKAREHGDMDETHQPPANGRQTR